MSLGHVIYSTMTIVNNVYVCVYVCVCARARVHAQLCLFVTPGIIACQPPLSIEFSRQEYRNGVPFPPPEDLPDSGTVPTTLVSPALTGRFFFYLCAAWEAPIINKTALYI